MSDTPDTETIIAAVHRWVETVVIELNLCPFAARELYAGRVRFTVTRATTEADLLARLQAELERLDAQPDTATTLLIHPGVLQDFGDYNQFLETADELLVAMGLDGVYQVASFHPNYQFADTEPDDAENYTNRSPWPLLHLLREEALQRSIASHPDTARIPQRNIALTQRLGVAHLQQLLQSCCIDKPG